MKLTYLLGEILSLPSSAMFQLAAYYEFWTNQKIDAIFHLGVSIILLLIYVWSAINFKLEK